MIKVIAMLAIVSGVVVGLLGYFRVFDKPVESVLIVSIHMVVIGIGLLEVERAVKAVKYEN